VDGCSYGFQDAVFLLRAFLYGAQLLREGFGRSCSFQYGVRPRKSIGTLKPPWKRIWPFYAPIYGPLQMFSKNNVTQVFLCMRPVGGASMQHLLVWAFPYGAQLLTVGVWSFL